jgi:hypothetical protein
MRRWPIPGYGSGDRRDNLDNDARCFQSRRRRLHLAAALMRDFRGIDNIYPVVIACLALAIHLPARKPGRW